MPNLAAFLMSLVGPLAKRVLAALGIGLITYTGVSAVLDGIQSAVISSIGGMTGAAAQIAAILGFQQSVGILLGAIATRLTLTQLTKWGKV